MQENDCPVCNIGPAIVYRLDEAEKDIRKHECDVDNRLDKMCDAIDYRFEKQSIEFTRLIKEQNEAWDKKFDPIWKTINQMKSVSTGILISAILILLTTIINFAISTI